MTPDRVRQRQRRAARIAEGLSYVSMAVGGSAFFAASIPVFVGLVVTCFVVLALALFTLNFAGPYA